MNVPPQCISIERGESIPAGVAESILISDIITDEPDQQTDNLRPLQRNLHPTASSKQRTSLQNPHPDSSSALVTPYDTTPDDSPGPSRRSTLPADVLTQLPRRVRHPTYERLYAHHATLKAENTALAAQLVHTKVLLTDAEDAIGRRRVCAQSSRILELQVSFAAIQYESGVLTRYTDGSG